MLSKDLLKKLKHIEIRSNRLVDELLAGDYRSSFKGKGMTFEDIREYYPGDDVRHIDWKVTARHNHTYVKQFSEERELNIFLMIDVSASNGFGYKRERIAEIGATLAFSANRNNDKVGALLFTDQVEKMIPSRKGRKHVLSIIDTLLSYEPKGKKTSLKEALQYYGRIMKKRTVLFIISDFADEGYEDSLKSLSRKHDIINICIVDPLEKKLPQGAVFTFEDLETGEVVEINNRKGEANFNALDQLPKGNVLLIDTEEDYTKKLKLFFRRRGIR